ncbi:MAG: hypothetical protein AAGF11_18025 [Myxococcota bacterium]
MSSRIATHRSTAWALSALVLLAGGIAAAQAYPSGSSEPPLAVANGEGLDMAYDSDREARVVSGWAPAALEVMRTFEASDEAWSELLTVHTDLAGRDNPSRPAVVGNYQVQEDLLVFRPRYGWSPGLSYRARLRPEALRNPSSGASNHPQPPVHTSFVIPAEDAPGAPPQVTTILPTADRVPENLLRLYIEFSQPMRRGDVREAITLLDEAGAPVEGPFLQIGQELWDRDMRHLTLMLDPGRIKQGVAPNREAGTPLRASKSYELVIGTELEDAHGRPLSSTYRKRFLVEAPDRLGPEPARWSLTPPSSGDRAALVVQLDGTIDPMLAPRMLRVEDAHGQPIPGRLTVPEGERTLEFVPDQRWEVGDYRLAILPTLEDYAGNQVRAPFDMSPGTIHRIETTGADRQMLTRSFEIVPNAVARSR